ncbi:MAG: enoyl-CoA hydratase-related protein [Solirubrobacterales bacterium]
MSTDSVSAEAPASAVPAVDPAVAGEIVTRSSLRVIVEACKIIEEGVGNAREIDLGMMTGAGVVPGPLTRADDLGLDNILAGLEHGATQWGAGFDPPVLLRRLVAQGRTGKASGQGFFAYPQPDAGDQTETVWLETRGSVAIAWLAAKPVNPISPDLVRDLKAVHQRVEADDSVRAMVIASSTLAIWSAGADLKAFAKMTSDEVGRHVDNTNDLMRGFERGNTVTIAAVNGAALGGGCELAMSADIRLAGESASFGQPEIALGILPGFGGTQRLPRLIGKGAAFELIASGDSIDAWRAVELGLVNRVLPDHELFDAAIAMAERLAEQAPLAIAQIKRTLDDPTLDAGIAREREAFVESMATEDAKEGVAAFLQKRAPKFRGK